jgi:hypothetical protein
MLITAFAVGGCRPREEPTPPAEENPVASDTEQPTAEDAAAALPASDEGDVPTPDETAPIALEKGLRFSDDLGFGLKLYGIENRKLLVLRALRAGQVIGDPVKVAINGDLVTAVATDLDGDQAPEILVVSRSRTKARVGSLVAFTFIDDRFTPLTVPDLDRAQVVGYRGGDAISIDGSHVVRRFPVFQGDAPTAKTRTIRYSLQPGYEFRVDSTAG